MIDELLKAAEVALDSECLCGAVTFTEEWVPKIVSRIQELEKQLSDTKTLAGMLETQLLEAEAKIKELE